MVQVQDLLVVGQRALEVAVLGVLISLAQEAILLAQVLELEPLARQRVALGGALADALLQVGQAFHQRLNLRQRALDVRQGAEQGGGLLGQLLLALQLYRALLDRRTELDELVVEVLEHRLVDVAAQRPGRLDQREPRRLRQRANLVERNEGVALARLDLCLAVVLEPRVARGDLLQTLLILDLRAQRHDLRVVGVGEVRVQRDEGLGRARQLAPHVVDLGLPGLIAVHLHDRAGAEQHGAGERDQEVLAQLLGARRGAPGARQECAAFAVPRVGLEQRAQGRDGAVGLTALEHLARAGDDPRGTFGHAPRGDQPESELELQVHGLRLLVRSHDEQGRGAAREARVAELARHVEQLAHARPLGIAALAELGRHAMHARHAIGAVDALRLGPVDDRGGRVVQAVVEAPQERTHAVRVHAAQRGGQPTRDPLGGERLGLVGRERARLSIARPRRQAARGPREVLLAQLFVRKAEHLVRVHDAQRSGAQGRGERQPRLANRPAHAVGDLEDGRVAVDLFEEARRRVARDRGIQGRNHHVERQLGDLGRAFQLVRDARVLEQQELDEHTFAVDGRGLALRGRFRPRHVGQVARLEAEVDVAAVELAVEDLEPRRVSDLGHAQVVDAASGVVGPGVAHTVAPHLRVLVGVRQQVRLAVEQTEDRAQALLRRESEEPFLPTSCEALEQLGQADAADVSLETHGGGVRSGSS